MGIQADFSDEESDFDSLYSSDGELVIADKKDRQDSSNVVCSSMISGHSKSALADTTKTVRKPIELKYIYGDDLSKSDIERRKFRTFKLIMSFVLSTQTTQSPVF